MASHILCDCEELVVLRLWHLGHSVLKASDFARISISMVLHCVQSTGLPKPWAKGYTKDWKQSRCEIHSSAHPNLLLSTLPQPYHAHTSSSLPYSQKPSVYNLPAM
jgi:uncharacterized membrane protein YjgN (DUF898 family)